MRFSVSQMEFQDAVAVVGKGVSSRTTLPVLAGILIHAQGDEIILQSTDQVASVKYVASALVEEEGSTVLPGKLLGDIVKNLPDAALTVTAEEGRALITCDRSKYEVKTLDAADFPEFPVVEPESELTLPFESFSNLVKDVARCVAKDESRPILTGICITAKDGKVEMAATDSYRLSVSKCPVEGTPEFSAVLPADFLQDLAGMKQMENTVSIAVSENQTIARVGKVTMIHRRLEGSFPDFRKLFPSGYEMRAEVASAAFAAAVKRTSLLSKADLPTRLRFDADKGTVTVLGIAQDVGSVQEEVEADIQGASFEIGFNSHYLLDGLRSLRTDKTIVEMESPARPGIFKSTDSQEFTYLIMPVRIA